VNPRSRAVPAISWILVLLSRAILASSDSGTPPATPATTAIPATASSMAAPPPAEAPAPRDRKTLSNRERKERTKKLAERYRKFLDDVEPILYDEERDVFLRLTDDALRDRFVDQFWRRRAELSDGRNGFREGYEERLLEVKENYGGTESDPSRIYLIQGPPSEIKKIDCDIVFVPLEIWIYARIPAWRRGGFLVFYRPLGLGPLKLWTPLDPVGVLFQPGQNDSYRCADGGYMARLIRQLRAGGPGGPGTLGEYGKLMAPPQVSLEGLESILNASPDLPTGAKPLHFGRVLHFTRGQGTRMTAEMTFLVARDDLARKTLGESSYVDADLVGEIVASTGNGKDERLVDSFRYRFDIPVDPKTPPVLPFIAERLLRPGLYRLRVRISDGNRNASGILEETLAVPDRAEGEDERRREEARGVLDNLSVGPAPPSSTNAESEGVIEISPLAGEALVGLKKIETIASASVSSVDFHLDNVVVGRRRRAPFHLDVDLGSLPRPRTIRVVARDVNGKEIGSDELVLNESRDLLKVRIVRPPKGLRSSGPTRVEAQVIIPEGHELENLQFFLNDIPVTRLFGPPFVATLDVPDQNQPSTIRVAASLEDGQNAEDLRLVNAPENLEEVEVERVELYVSATQDGRNAAGLDSKDFRVGVDGAPVVIEGFDVVRNLPIRVVLALDTSESMLKSLPEAEKAAADFIRKIMTPRDRAAVIRFDDEPQVLQRFTADPALLQSSLAGLRADRGTALYDAVVYSLYQCQGQKGRRAVVLLTDGRDTSSRFDFNHTLEYAKRSGVTIYTIGLSIPIHEIDVRNKLSRLAEESGGRVFQADSARELAGIYTAINDDLRTQYRLSFAPPGKADGHWHKVRVDCPARKGIELRAASGYYR